MNDLIKHLDRERSQYETKWKQENKGGSPHLITGHGKWQYSYDIPGVGIPVLHKLAARLDIYIARAAAKIPMHKKRASVISVFSPSTTGEHGPWSWMQFETRDELNAVVAIRQTGQDAFAAHLYDLSVIVFAISAEGGGDVS